MISISTQCVPRIPLRRIVYLIGQQITRIVTEVVRRTEGIVEGQIYVIVFYVLHHNGTILAHCRLQNSRYSSSSRLNHLFIGRSSRLVIIIFAWQHHITWCEPFITNLTAVFDNIRLRHEQFLIKFTQLIIVPIANGVVLIIGDIVDDKLLVVCERHTR